MTNSALKIRKKFDASPVLRSIFTDAAIEHHQTEQLFKLLGWGDLPLDLKLTIKEDVKGYVDELNGQYSSCCTLIQRRRESVDFWVNSYKDGICSLETALDALKVNRL